MVALRKNAGNIIDPNVHDIGIIALGSHLENHGPALPIDTDSKIAAHIAYQASLKTGAKFLGIIYPAHELDEIDHGIHVSLDVLVNNIIENINSAKKFLNVNKISIVNSHGGNLQLMDEISKIEKETDTLILVNNNVILNEGPHGGTGEVSMGKVLGILNEDEVVNQDTLDKYEEVGLYGFSEARQNDPNIEAGAIDVQVNGVHVDESYGNELLNQAIKSVTEDVKNLLKN
ncbi:MAG: 2-amino-5-formylamino-6-ribosylaminopyrimidin-4(3H)-one 5'-monophosphate deformylase [archaeon]|nr:2-amino-5-formylamino-6-ribosylaminopyrimidin-4(3H)-one 5'-monophosphate deformylase [archaeon]